MRRSLPFLLLTALPALFMLPAVSAQEQPLSPALASLVAAERAFARLSVEQGVRAAFMTYFAEDGINFQPHPTNTKEAYRKRPAPTAPQPFTLDWFPIYADVSRAGDLGYTTGPYAITPLAPQTRPTQHGYYFSVWQKQADGSWKVVVDLGISTPAPSPDAPAPAFQQPRKLGGDLAPAQSKFDSTQAELLAADRALLQAERARGVAAALPAAMIEEARLHRNDMFPIVGRRAISAYLKGRQAHVNGVPMKAATATSGDLGYTYGSYELRAAATQEKGYYVRVWKRVGNKWRVALDTASPLPPDAK
jgi:ketosteroid isomerase-like protein